MWSKQVNPVNRTSNLRGKAITSRINDTLHPLWECAAQVFDAEVVIDVCTNVPQTACKLCRCLGPRRRSSSHSLATTDPSHGSFVLSCPSLPNVSPHLLIQSNLKNYPPLSEPDRGKLLLKICRAYKIGKIDFEPA